MSVSRRGAGCHRGGSCSGWHAEASGITHTSSQSLWISLHELIKGIWLPPRGVLIAFMHSLTPLGLAEDTLIKKERVEREIKLLCFVSTPALCVLSLYTNLHGNICLPKYSKKLPFYYFIFLDAQWCQPLICQLYILAVTGWMLRHQLMLASLVIKLHSQTVWEHHTDTDSC